MTDPIAFDAQTTRLALPLLHVGQAQKEVFVNEALARLDVLVHAAVEGELATPPATATEGQCWVVASPAGGEWAGQEARIACRQGGGWTFAVPRDGMRVLDRSTGQDMRFFSTWKKAAAPAEPTGGTVVDSHARSAIASLISVLRVMGVLPSA